MCNNSDICNNTVMYNNIVICNNSDMCNIISYITIDSFISQTIDSLHSIESTIDYTSLQLNSIRDIKELFC